MKLALAQMTCSNSMDVNLEKSLNLIKGADDTEQLLYANIYTWGIREIREEKNYTQLRRTELYK